VNIANNKPSVTVTPVAADANESITVNGTAVSSGSTSAAIPVDEGGTANISIQVTSQDKSIVKTYTVAVSRAQSNNATLSAMGPSSGPLSPLFAPGTTSYTLNVASNVATFTATPVTADA